MTQLRWLALGGVEVSGRLLAELIALRYLNFSPPPLWHPAMLDPLRNLTQAGRSMTARSLPAGSMSWR